MPLNVFQQIFSLSLVSNLALDYKGDQASLQEALRLGLERELPFISPEWKVVWGPVVLKHKPEDKETGADSSCYVAFHPALRYEDDTVHPTYVIAIAGTPKESLYMGHKKHAARFDERRDFTQSEIANYTVNDVVNFQAWVTRGIHNSPEKVLGSEVKFGHPHIAMEIANAVHLLLCTRAPSGSASEDEMLLGFIASTRNIPDARVIITGHSFGGALSPLLALALVKNEHISASNTLTYPTAGPSPGDVHFAELFEQTFPPIKSGKMAYQGWNLNLVNTLDVVPQAWCTFNDFSPEQNLRRVPSMYGGPEIPLVKATTSLALSWSSMSNVDYKSLRSQSFSFLAPPDPPTNLEEFIQNICTQHLEAYIQEFEVPLPVLEEDIVQGNGLVGKTEEEKRSAYPLISDFEWARVHPEEAEEMGRRC